MNNTAISNINITANFRDLQIVPPVIQEGLTVDVYFICDGVLYKGHYHINKNFYAYKILGGFDCFASKNGNYEGFEGGGKNNVCTHWCYVNDLKISIQK